jgi:hypothetical protein
MRKEKAGKKRRERIGDKIIGGKEPVVTLAGGSLFTRKIYVLASNINRLEYIGGSNLFAHQIYAGSSRMSLANMLTYIYIYVSHTKIIHV